MVHAVWKILSQPGLLGLILAHAVCGTVAAQPAPAGNGAGPSEVAAEGSPTVRVEESKPSITYWVKDGEGQLVPVIDMNYEDIVRLYKLDRRLVGPEQPDRYSLQQWTARGVVRNSWVELDVAIELIVNVDQWCRVPLGLSGAVLTAPIEYEGPGEHIAGIESNTGGYVAWIRSSEKGPHTLRLKTLVPLERVLGESRLRLHPPRSVNSRLTLVVDSAKMTADVSSGATLLPLKRRDDGTTELTVVGLDEELRITWQVADDRSPGPPAVLEAKGNLVVKVRGLTGIVTEGRLTVRSSNGPLRSFRVKLPAGARVVSGKQPAYGIFPVKSKRNGNGNGNGQANLWEVRILQPTSDPVTVRLDTRQTIPERDLGSRTEVALMEVIDAVRQSGSIALQVTGEASVDWLAEEGVVRVDEPPEGQARDDVTAWFEYSQQPSSLRLRVARKITRISVQPLYVVQVASDAARLHAQLSYDVRGTKTDLLELDLAGWRLDSVEPAALVKAETMKSEIATQSPEILAQRVAANVARFGSSLGIPRVWPLKLLAEGVRPVGPAFVQIPLAKPSNGRIVIDVYAHRTLRPGVDRMEFSLPRPASAVVNGASLVVLPDDNVRLEPRPDDLRGLIADQNPPRVELPERTQQPLHFREQADASETLFVSGFEVHRRRVAVEQATHVEANARQARVEQRLSYRIAYEPLDVLILQAPSELLRMDSLTLTCDGRTLDAKALVTGEGERDNDLIELRVPLSADRIGAAEISVQYTAPVERASRGEASKVLLPLVMPVSSEPPGDGVDETFAYGEHLLTADLPNDIRLEPPGDPWTALENAEADRENRYSTEQPVARVELELVFAGARGAEVTLVRKAWIQPWLTSTTRRDRAAFRVKTSARQIRFRLPAGADVENLDLFLDGVSLTPNQVGEQEFVIELNGEFGQREYLLELWYPFTQPRPRRGTMSLELPRIENSDWVERMYWQVVLPPYEQLLGTPSSMTSETTWGWRGVRWGSQPQLTTGELESWINTTWSSDVPAGANQYLFSRFGSLEAVQLYTAPRSVIMLIASGVLLVAGLLWTYVPLIRRAWILLPAVCGFGFFAIAYPEPAAFGARAAAVGLGLLVVARVLYWAIVERRTSRTVIHGTSMVSADRSTTETQLQPPRGSSHGGSATVPAGPPLPAAEP